MIYMLDPPYLISFSEYNKIWNEEKELELLNFLDELNKKNIKFAISNITAYKWRKNEIFLNWMKNIILKISKVIILVIMIIAKKKQMKF